MDDVEALDIGAMAEAAGLKVGEELDENIAWLFGLETYQVAAWRVARGIPEPIRDVWTGWDMSTPDKVVAEVEGVPIEEVRKARHARGVYRHRRGYMGNMPKKQAIKVIRRTYPTRTPIDRIARVLGLSRGTLRLYANELGVYRPWHAQRPYPRLYKMRAGERSWCDYTEEEIRAI